MINKKSVRFITLSLILILLLIIFINYSFFINYLNTFLENQIQVFGYSGVLVFVFFLEFLPQPLLSALIPFTTGLIFGLNFKYLFVILLFGSITANYLAYLTGVYYGEFAMNFLINKKNYQKSIKWFEKYGKISIAILALTPLPYFPIMGGIFKMTFKEFTIFAIIPRIIHLSFFSLLIYLLT